MLKIARITIALAAAGLAIPAIAGNSWPQTPSSKQGASAPAKVAVATKKAGVKNFAPVGGFAYTGEGVGWEVAQHKYVWTGSALAHSDECDHALRTAAAVTIDDIEAGRKLWPGG
jgi:hypothetical protein